MTDLTQEAAEQGRRWVKPMIGRVPKPGGGQLATGGEAVAWDGFWARRLADGDIAEMSANEVRALLRAAEKGEAK